MADIRIDLLPAPGPLTGAEIVPVVQAAAGVQVTTQSIADLAQGTVEMLLSSRIAVNSSRITRNESDISGLMAQTTTQSDLAGVRILLDSRMDGVSTNVTGNTAAIAALQANQAITDPIQFYFASQVFGG